MDLVALARMTRLALAHINLFVISLAKLCLLTTRKRLLTQSQQ